MATKDKIKELIQEAVKAKENSYSPYSKFRVGAALLTDSGKIFRGCNVENASYPCGDCAERTAITNAVSDGHKCFEALALASDNSGYITPCGLCRQVIREFSETLPIYCAKEDGSYKEFHLNELLPKSFGPDDLNPPSDTPYN